MIRKLLVTQIRMAMSEPRAAYDVEWAPDCDAQAYPGRMDQYWVLRDGLKLTTLHRALCVEWGKYDAMPRGWEKYEYSRRLSQIVDQIHPQIVRAVFPDAQGIRWIEPCAADLTHDSAWVSVDLRAVAENRAARLPCPHCDRLYLIDPRDATCPACQASIDNAGAAICATA